MGECICEAGFDGAGCEYDLIFPFRCSEQRHGFESSRSCKRGLAAMGTKPDAGTQVLRVSFSPDEKVDGARQIVNPL